MKIFELRRLIREEVSNVVKENLESSEAFDILDSTGQSVVAKITKTSTGSQIEKSGEWTYSYSDSPFDLLYSLFKLRAVRTASGDFIETSAGALAKTLKSRRDKYTKI